MSAEDVILMVATRQLLSLKFMPASAFGQLLIFFGKISLMAHLFKAVVV